MAWEDTQAGETDIAGDPQPPPARTPGDIKGAAGRAVHGKPPPRPKSAPQQQGGGNPIQQLGQDVGQAAGGVEKGLQSLQQGEPFPGVSEGLQGWNPVNWADQVANDSEMTWALSRRLYGGITDFFNPDHGPYRDGVAQVWQGNTAQDRVLRSLLPSLVQSTVPLASLPQVAGQAQMYGRVATGQETPQQGLRQQGQFDERAVQQGPAGLATALTTAPAPEAKAAQLAIYAGVPVAESALAGDRNGLLWNGVAAGLLSMVHLPPGLRSQMMRTFGDQWPAIEQRLQQVVNDRRDLGRNVQEPQAQARVIKDWIGEQLARGGLVAGEKLAAKGVEADAPRRIAAELGTHGEVRLLPGETAKKTRQLLGKLGVEDVDQLVERAAQGSIGGRAAKLVRDHWKTLGLPYDLSYRVEGEAPLRDPRAVVQQIDNPDVAARATAHVGALNHLLHEIGSGVFTTSGSPAQAILRSLAGHTRTLDLTWQRYMSTLLGSIEHLGVNDSVGTRLMRAAEGDENAYYGLPFEARAAVDSWALVRSALREQSADTAYAKRFVANYVPRLDLLPEEMAAGRGRPSRASVLAREARKSRELGLHVDPESGRMFLGQRFRTVADANKALESQRADLRNRLMSASTKLTGDLRNDPEASAIRGLLKSDPAQARMRADALVAAKYPAKDANFLRAINRAGLYQAKSVATAQALRELERTVIETKSPLGGVVRRAAAIVPENQRQAEEFAAQGYEHIEDPKFRGYMFDGEFAKDLNRYVKLAGQGGLRNSAIAKAFLKAESKLVGWAMYSPAIHGLNMAGRVGMAALANPLRMASYLAHGAALLPHFEDDASFALRSEAFNAGVMTPRTGRRWADGLVGSLHDVMGDTEDSVPLEGSDTKRGRLAGTLSSIPRPDRKVNDYFWRMVGDFGVMMYHVEKASALHGVPALGIAPLGDEAARMWAARRANTWMGMVAPEDTNPVLHDASRLVAFAPNWWRTWAELALPIYRRSGIFANGNAAKFAAYQAAKTVLAAFAFQKMTGAYYNMMLSGHLQSENQPGQQDRIEISNPAVLHALQGTGILPSDPSDPSYVDPNSGTNPRTGAVYSVENPMARTQYDVEQALGLQSGQPDWKPSDLHDGLTKFMAARLSPLVNSLAAVNNVDLYGTLTQGQLRQIDPANPGVGPTPAGLVYGAMLTVPGGQQFAQELQRTANQTGGQSASLFGTKVPSSVQEWAKAAGDTASRAIFTGLTGINPAHAIAQRTRGMEPSDEDFQKIGQEKQQYAKEMQTLNAQVMTGQITPSQWRAAYESLATQNAITMESLYRGSPQYVHGAEAMLSDYEALTAQATDPNTGQLDTGRLDQLQQQFRTSGRYSVQQLQQMDALLQQNDTRYPILKTYHHAVDAYHQFQEQWAAQNGVDVTTLRQEISEYGSLYGDRAASTRFLVSHRDLNAYERAKREWDASPAGTLYGLFFNSTSANNQLRRLGLGPAQYVAMQQQQQPAAVGG